MLKTIRNAWSIPDLRKKLLFTLMIIIVFRIGSVIPVPFLDMSALATAMNGMNEGNTMLAYLNTLSGGAFANATLFAMGVTPYINSSIIMQLLTVAIPPLERMAKEGEAGRRKIGTITRYVTVGLGLVQGGAYWYYLHKSGVTVYTEGFSLVFSAIVIILVFTAGTALMMWLGEQINTNGIGNGISIILFAGIVARCPSDVKDMVELAISDPNKYVFPVIFVLLIYVVMIGFIVLMNEAERRIPIQYAKRVVGRKQYGGQNTHIPVKIAMSGVMPIIFAMAFMSIPQTIEMFVAAPTGDPATWSFGQKFYHGFLNFFNYSSGWYAVIYFILIIAFNYFYVSMQYNPIEIANNLRQNNGGIPGIRPGKPTSDFIQRVLSKITLIGAVCLGIIAIFPILFHMAVPAMNISMGGTSILIIVSVVLETVRTMESQMMMRHHKGFLE